MAANIVVDQAAKPAGIAGKAREDLDLGTDILLTAAGGPFLQHAWSIVDRPIDIITPVESTSVLATPAASATVVTPVDVEGTYLAELLVDSGSGLGATQADIARITFYAGAALAANPASLPRRRPAARETLEHNVNDALRPGGNDRGWAQEWERWFAVISSLGGGAVDFAAARVSLPGGGPAALVGSDLNIATATRTGVGVVDIVFTNPAADALYGVVCTARGSGGHCFVSGELASGFTVNRGNAAGVLTDADFSFVVKAI